MPALVAVSALTLTACGGGGGTKASDSAGKGASSTVASFTVGTKADSTGPAADVPGAKQGGTAYSIEPTGFDHLDPSQQYVNQLQAVGMLYSRQLTNYKTDPTTGKTMLVGDLATDTGTPSDGGKTWTWTLKEGLKFEDGTPITSKDVKYAVERLYADYQTFGATYFPQWLSGTDYRKAYQGPDHGDLPDSVIGTPDAQTVVFHFQSVHSDANFAAAMPDITAIEKSADTKQQYDTHPVSIGPYKIKDYQPDKSLDLVKNPNWDPKTDPLRHQYVDGWHFELNVTNPQLTQRLMGGAGTDKDAITLAQIADAGQVATIQNDPQYKSRTISQYTPYVDVFSINTARVTDPKVRLAMAKAFPSAAVLRQLGGPSAGDPAGNLVSPTVSGWQNTDPLGLKATPNGDQAAAKKILQDDNKLNYHIVLAYANTPKWQTISATVQDALNRAGFNVEIKALDATTYYTVVGKVDNGFDMYRTGWGADWPNGSTVVPPTLDGRLIGDGLSNYSHYNSAATNSAIDQVYNVADPAQAATQWMNLADKVLSNDVPAIPYAYDKFFQVYGAGLGGVAYNPVLGCIDPSSVYIK
ncbi:ABC transporter substrate-binding protein [Kitasatospora kifunensis]|uniref:Peptide/nickel transport system substrate-binding protein n=1 Tax=Kitasatospora kifunensis TaxID=58351 RepID=A0A7W7R2Q3_KITKI|nr:ABC transporter substrate-binding protein [Kitasatospora kifunensis]MBB4923741.1 peptide/nickel transport system substrate-binding protein [Kitasatospora kifunensis]